MFCSTLSSIHCSINDFFYYVYWFLDEWLNILRNSICNIVLITANWKQLWKWVYFYVLIFANLHSCVFAHMYTFVCLITNICVQVHACAFIYVVMCVLMHSGECLYTLCLFTFCLHVFCIYYMYEYYKFNLTITISA